MDTSQDFDLLITKYSEDLMQMKKKWSEWGIVTEEKRSISKEPSDYEPSAEAVALTDGEGPTPENTQKTEMPDEAEAPKNDPPEAMNDYPSAAPEFYANFQARVFSGDQAYPIEGAKVLIYLGGRLHTFLITNENGETQRVKIESSPDENALTPNSENQQLDYLADIYADGFAEKKGLLVSAVGGSDILLNVQLTPEPERID